MKVDTLGGFVCIKLVLKIQLPFHGLNKTLTVDRHSDLEADWSSIDSRRQGTYHRQRQKHGCLVANRQVDPRFHKSRELCIMLEQTLLALLQLNKLNDSDVLCTIHQFKIILDARSAQLERSPCYVLRMLFIYFLWPPYAAAQVNGGSRNFYTWTQSVNREVTTWIFCWSSLNYRVGQKVTKFGIFSDPARKLSALTPERGRIL